MKFDFARLSHDLIALEKEMPELGPACHAIVCIYRTQTVSDLAPHWFAA